MKLLEIGESQKDQYNKFVAAQGSGSFLQSYDWGEWQVRLGRKVYRFKIVDDGKNLVGAIQLVKMPLAFGKYYLYAPYGPVVDLKFKIEDLRFLIQELRKRFSNAVFFRIEPKNALLVTSNLSIVTKSANIQPAKTLLIDLKKTLDQILAEMHPKTRYNIKLARRHGVEMKEEFGISVGHGLYFKEALELISKTSKRQGFASYPQSYYAGMVDFFSLDDKHELKAHLYTAIYRGELLACAIMVDFGKTRNFLFGGSSLWNKNVMAPYLLHFKAMTDAKLAGLETYDFWGIETASGKVPGFVKFKLGFGGKQSNYAGAYDSVLNKAWYGVYAVMRSLNKAAKKISLG